MEKSFDDLYNEFFRRKQNSLNKGDKELRSEELRNEVKRIMDFIDSFKNVIPLNESEIENMEEGLGDPHIIEYFTEGYYYIERKIWYLDDGRVIFREISSDKPFFTNVEEPKAPEKPLEEQLKEALANEEYERAAKIRDLINPPKKRGRPKKQK
jgi:excinuclease UvrABC helicase subunit UvrB